MSALEAQPMNDSTDVLVVGAGPVGLLMAAELRRHGVRCRIVDRLAEPMGWVKALGVSQRTLELWDDLGIAAEALDAGMYLLRQRVFIDRQDVLDADTAFPDEAPYKYPLSLPQPQTERILRDHLARFGLHVERGVELSSFEEDGGGVRVTLARTGGSPETVHCRYLVGCDGAHSTVRHGLGLPFEGGRFPAEFLLADVEIGWEFIHDAACLFMEVHDGALDNLLVCIPYRDPAAPDKPRYRVSTMAQPVSAVDWDSAAPVVTHESALGPTLEQVREIVHHFVPVPAVVGELRWSSVFRISHRLVPRYRVGRVFLAGDAAHIHPPTGGQGMNTGLQDAYNLAWKLALDVQGLSQPDLLDSYDAERQPVGQAVVSRTRERSLHFADRSQHDPQVLRDDSQLCVNYRGCGWVAEALSRPDALADGPRPGDRAPDVGGLAREGLTFPLRLFDLLRGTHHTLLVYGTGNAGDVAVPLVRRCGGRLRAYRIVAPEAAGSRVDACPTLVDCGRHFQRVYAATGSTAYLIRPDGYVGFRTDAVTPQALDTYLSCSFRR
jgi:2-polyprenyl-6-methoxyphenol hydroxylase-like FAD-dependent oxidoreductase